MQLETYVTHVYALYLSWYTRRPGEANFAEESAHGMALVTVGVPVIPLILLCALYIDMATGLGAPRAANLVLGLGVAIVSSKWLDKIIRKRQNQIKNMVSTIRTSSPKGPLLALGKGVSLLVVQLVLVVIVVIFIVGK
ncbi:MAG: hypothetical protein K0U72_01465 [Gammaproteobacteria bacterium]|nr:hypothetical protein [Gammaproteobacteria bacterium]